MKISDELWRRMKDGERAAVDEFANQIIEECLRVAPQVMQTMAKNAAAMYQLSQDFYKENPELTEHKPLVIQTINQVEEENPGMPYNKVVGKARNRVFKALREMGDGGSCSRIDHSKRNRPLGLDEMDSRFRKG